MTTEATGFLYPFIEADERDADHLVAELATSAQAKLGDSVALRAATVAQWRPSLDVAGAEIAGRFRRGGRLFAFGNGGSATDAEGAVALFVDPPHGRALPARSLVDDPAILTALGNDVGFDLVFSRQLIAHARDGDIVVGFSTSGGSVDVLRAFDEAKRHDILTVGLCGYEGGAMAASGSIDHCLVVHSDSVHRIQESHSALLLDLWMVVQRVLDEQEVTRD